MRRAGGAGFAPRCNTQDRHLATQTQFRDRQKKGEPKLSFVVTSA